MFKVQYSKLNAVTTYFTTACDDLQKFRRVLALVFSEQQLSRGCSLSLGAFLLRGKPEGEHLVLHGWFVLSFRCVVGESADLGDDRQAYCPDTRSNVFG